MVHGSGVDDPARSAAYADAPETGRGGPGRRPRRSWNGGGGRWFVRTVQAVLLAAARSIGYRGSVTAHDETATSRSGTSGSLLVACNAPDRRSCLTRPP